jgi:RND family efflux transporter MFP subunit
VDVTKAVAGRAKAMLGYAKIRAPFDGIVIARRVNTGEFVQPSGGKGEWLFTVARLNPMRAVISIPEADAALLDLGKSAVTLQVPALTGPALPGPLKITRNSWALDPTSRSLRAEVDLPNKDGRLRPGMYLHARIVNPTAEHWTLPTSAVIKKDDGMFCCQIDEMGKVIYRRVQVGRGDGERIEILRCQKVASTTEWDELTGNETFAVRPSGLLDGATVRMMATPK